MKILKSLFVNNPLYFAILLPMIADGTLTILGQDVSYWTNNKLANEASPAYFVMAFSPVLFILGSLAWYVFMYWLIKRIKHPFNLMFTVALIAGHTWGSAGWMSKILRESLYLDFTLRSHILFSWSIKIIYFALIGIIAGLSITQYIKSYKDG